MRDPYYTNEDLESIINDLENETENSMKVALRVVLLMLKDIKDNQIKKMDKCNNVHTQPTDNPMDIITGLNKRGLISDEDMKEAETKTYALKCDLPEQCNCPLCRDGK